MNPNIEKGLAAQAFFNQQGQNMAAAQAGLGQNWQATVSNASQSTSYTANTLRANT